MAKHQNSPLHCEHANEVPVICGCPPNCYCQTHTCKNRPKDQQPTIQESVSLPKQKFDLKAQSLDAILLLHIHEILSDKERNQAIKRWIKKFQVKLKSHEIAEINRHTNISIPRSL